MCNGRDDCGDNSDETDCELGIGSRSSHVDVVRGTILVFNGTSTESPRRGQCPKDTFWCLSGECKNFTSVCNNKEDCIDGSDEGPGETINS